MGSDYTPSHRTHVPPHGGLAVQEGIATPVVPDLPHQGNKESGWTNSHYNEEVHPLD